MPLDLTAEVVIRWNDCDAKYIPLLKEGGITAVLVPPGNEAFEKACQEAGLKVAPQGDIQLLALDAVKSAPPGAVVALTNGLWPGVSRGAGQGSDEFTASATQRPWVDSNGYWVGILRTLYPKRPALLGYLPDDKAGVKPNALLPFNSLELALAEAWANGGNYLLALEPRYREKLLGGDTKALDAWRGMGRTAQWLVKNADLFRQPAFPIVTALAEADDSVVEIVNLLYRHNVSPALVSAANPPAPDPARRLALVAASINPPNAEVRRRLLSNAEAGTALLVDAQGADAWWRDPRLKKVRSQEDRDFYTLGRGQVIAYHEQISDPGEFAFDVIDAVSQKRRAARLWNADQVIARATSCPPGKNGGRALLVLINYGYQFYGGGALSSIQGNYTHATLLRPEAEPLPLPTFKRGTATEVRIPDLGRVGVLVVS